MLGSGMFKAQNHSRPNLLLVSAETGDIPAFVINDNHERRNDILMLWYKPTRFIATLHFLCSVSSATEADP
jgi:hypothetical protein